MLCLDLLFRVKTDHLSPPCQKKNKFHIGHDLTDCFFFPFNILALCMYKNTSWHSLQITGIYLSICLYVTLLWDFFCCCCFNAKDASEQSKISLLLPVENSIKKFCKNCWRQAWKIRIFSTLLLSERDDRLSLFFCSVENRWNEQMFLSTTEVDGAAAGHPNGWCDSARRRKLCVLR